MLRGSILGAAFSLLLGCGLLTPDDGIGRVDRPTLIASIQGHGLVRIEVGSFQVLAKSAAPRDNEVVVWSRDDEVLWRFGQGQEGGLELTRFSASEFRKLSSDPWPTVRAEAPPNGISWTGGEALLSPHGGEVVFYPVWVGGFAGLWKGGTAHFGALRPDTRRFRPDYAGPVSAGLVAVLPKGPVARNGAILALGRREGYRNEEWTHLYIVDAASMSLVDSIPAAELPARVQLVSMEAGLDGRHLLFDRDLTTLVAYDLLTRSVAWELPIPSFWGQMTVDPWSEWFLLSGRATLQGPASGILQFFDGDLTRTSIDLRGTALPSTGGPSVNATAFGDDGLLYALIGAGPWGPVWLVVVDPDGGTIERVVDLGLAGNPVGLYYVPAGG